jgi:flagellar hook-associated protein 2
MATISSALSSASTTQPATFNGTSQYAGDLQQAINQAVAIASIPLTQLENNISTLQSESGELSTVQTDFNGLQTAIQQLSSSSGSGSLAASVTDNTVASVTVDSSAAATAGTYDLNVISPGSSTTTLSSNGLPTVSDPNSSSISSSASFTLSVNGTNTTITPSSNTLDALEQAINSANAGVTATIINIGPPSAPDYRLSLESTALGGDSIQLNDASQNPLLTVLSTGMPAQYQVDGQPPLPNPISSTSSTVTLAPGVTANLLQTGDTTVTVAADSSAAANALSAFATAYNSTLAELSNNRGTSGGALTGQSIVLQLQQSLGSLVQFTGTGSGNVQSIADLGLTFNSQGQLTFDQSTFDNAEATNATGVASFLGTTTGGGFLTNATNVLNQVETPSTGLFAETQSSYQNQITSDNSQITDTQARITAMQNNMTAQMTQADATIATLESQVTYFTTLFADSQNELKTNS